MLTLVGTLPNGIFLSTIFSITMFDPCIVGNLTIPLINNISIKVNDPSITVVLGPLIMTPSST